MLTYFFLALLSTVGAFTDVATFLQTYLANGTSGAQTQWQQNTLSFTCSNTDFQDPSQFVGNLSYNIVCNPPVYPIQTILREFVPREVRLFKAEYSEADSIALIGPNIGAPNGASSPSGRRLMATEATDNQFRACISAAQTAAAVQACATTAGFVSGCPGTFNGNGTCMPGNSGPFTHTNALQWLGSQIDTLGQIATWLTQQQIINTDVQQTFSTLNESLFLQLDALKELYNQSNQTVQAVQALANNTQLQYDNVKQQLNATYQTLVLGYKVDAAISDRERYFSNITIANFQAVINATQAMVANLTQNFFTLIQQQFTGMQFSRASNAALNKAQRLVGVRRGLIMEIFDLVDQALALGLKLYFDPAQPGQRPGPATAAQQQVVLDTVYLNFVNGSNQPFTVHQYTLSWLCDVSEVVDTFYESAIWSDLVAMLGPGGCSKLPGTTASNCQCWIQLQHQQCPASTNFHGGPFDWSLITTQTSLTPYSLSANAQQYCSTGVVSNGFYNNRIIDSLVDWNAFLGGLCQTSLASQLAPVPGGTLGGITSRRMQIVSSRLGTLMLTSPSTPAQSCKPNYDWVFSGYNNGEQNLVFAIYTALVTGQNLLLSDNFVWENVVHGIMPNFLTYELNPFQLLSNNKTYTTHRIYFTAVSHDTRPVFQVIPGLPQTSVTVEAYAQPPVCDLEGCIFGTPVSSTTTATAVASVPFNALLPTGDDAIVGEWRTRGIPAMTEIFDTPTGATPIDNVNSARAYTITYNWQPIPQAYNLSVQTSYEEDLPQPHGPWPESTVLGDWLANNAVSYDARQGRFSLDFTQVTFSNGRCQFGLQYVPQWVCNMFNHFRLSALTNMRQGKLFLIANEWSYLATVGITVGEVIQRVFAGCPQISFTSFANGFVQLTLTNDLPVPLEVIVRTTNLSPLQCPNTPDVPYAMLPGKQTTSELFPCGQQVLTVFQRTASGLSVCKQGLNITFDATSQANVLPFVSPVTNRSVVDDTILAQVALSQIQLVNFIASAVPFLAVDFTPDLTQPERDVAIQNLLNAYNASLLVTKNAATTVVTQTAEEAIQPFIDASNAAGQQVEATEARLTVLEQQLSAQTAKLGADVAQQAINTNATVNQIGFQIQVDEGFIQTLANEQVQGGACNWCGGGSEIWKTYFASWICPILCSIVTFLIPIAIFGGIGLCACCLCCKTKLPWKIWEQFRSSADATQADSGQKKTPSPDRTPSGPKRDRTPSAQTNVGHQYKVNARNAALAAEEEEQRGLLVGGGYY